MQYLEKASMINYSDDSENESLNELYYQLGISYQLNLEWDKAIKCFKEYQKKI